MNEEMMGTMTESSYLRMEESKTQRGIGEEEEGNLILKAVNH